MQQHGEEAVRLCAADEADRLVELLERIAAELAWQPGEQLRDYQSQAVHFAAYVGGVLAGGMQLVPAARCRTLPCELVWPEARLPRRAETAHISILALKKEYRGTAQLLWPLCVAMWRYCAAHRIADISLEVTPDLYRLYLRLGWPLEIVGDLRPHWGRPLLPVPDGDGRRRGGHAAADAAFRRVPGHRRPDEPALGAGRLAGLAMPAVTAAVATGRRIWDRSGRNRMIVTTGSEPLETKSVQQEACLEDGERPTAGNRIAGNRIFL